MNRERNCYSCKGFGRIVKNYMNQRIVKQGRRLEYEDNQNTSNLNGKKNLIVFD